MCRSWRPCSAWSLAPIPIRPSLFPLGGEHVNRLAKWPVFRKRNVVNLLGKDIRAPAGPRIWLNATVTEILADAGGSGVRVLARSPGGDSLRVTAPKLIVAAGSIETTRLALLIDRQNGGVIGRDSPALGRYFTDHLSTGVAEIMPLRQTALNRIIGFRFTSGGGMRNIRFELAGSAPARTSLPPGFAHVGFETDRPGGFDALRELFRWLQMRRLPPPGVLVDLARNTPWLARAVWWRFVHKRLLFPAHARLIVHMVIEQHASPDNRITLSQTETDPFGVPLAEIFWRVLPEDIDILNRSTDLFEETWNSTGFATYGTWISHAREAVGEDIVRSGGIYHPTGSTRMGRSADEGVVDRDLRLFACPQIQLVSTSVLPSGGGANPTMMLLLLALRCVDQHVADRGG